MSVQPINLVSYGLTNALQKVFPFPIVALRVPTTADKAQIGTVWVYKTGNAVYVITSIVNNLANWVLLEVGGGAGLFASLTVTPGPISLTGTTTINTAGAAGTSIGNAASTTSVLGAINLNIGGAAVTAIGNAASTTDILGTVDINAAGASATTIGNALSTTNLEGTVDINTAGAGVTSIGVGGTGIVTIGNNTGGVITSGEVLVTGGSVVINTAGQGIDLPGPIQILSGAGAPAAGLALEAGDLYIRTDPAGATSRIYVATGAGVWTNVTCAA